MFRRKCMALNTVTLYFLLKTFYWIKKHFNQIKILERFGKWERKENDLNFFNKKKDLRHVIPKKIVQEKKLKLHILSN